MPTYSVRVDDGRYGLGDFGSCEAAVRRCKLQVDELLRKEMASRLSRGDDPAGAVNRLFSGIPHCDTPFIISEDLSCRFSAYDYASGRWRELLAEMAANPDGIATCIHLRPLERLLEARGIALGPARESPYGADSGLWSPVSCTFDGEDLKKKLGLAACVDYAEYDGRAAGSDATFYCKACKRAIMGLHPRHAPSGTPRVAFDANSASPSTIPPANAPSKEPAARSVSCDLEAKSKWLQNCLNFGAILNCSVLFLAAAGFLVLEMVFMVKTGGAREAMNFIHGEFARNHPWRIIGFFACIPMQVALTLLQRKLARSTKRGMIWADIARNFRWNLVWAVPVALSWSALYLPFWALSRIGRKLAGAKSSLEKPIGIMATIGFSEMIPAGTPLPHTYSETFGNAADNQTAIEITIVQTDATGSEKIVVAVIDKLPPRPKGKLSVIVTIIVDASRNLRLKATVPETAYIKELGPFPVK